MSPVICVDAEFLKMKYGGEMLIAVALDANTQLYPLAFGVVDSESHNSWTYFARMLKHAIDDVEGLAFVSDRYYIFLIILKFLSYVVVFMLWS